MSTSTARRAGPARARLTILILFAALALLAGCRTAPLTGGVDVPRVMAGTPSAPLVAPGVDRAFDWVPAKAYYERRGLPRHVWTAASSEKPGSVEAKGGDEAGGGGDLAKQAQNPIASMISLPFQDNINFPIGPHDRVQNVLNIQPVVPVKLGKWTLVNRAIVPIIYQPDIRSSNGSWTGIGDINLTTFVVPPAKGDFTWGVGPVILFPSATDAHVGKRTWGIGPSAVAVFMPGKWVLGALVNNIWSIEDTSEEGGFLTTQEEINQFLGQIFVNYNLPNQWFLTSAPIITADWNAEPDNRWVVPVGGGVGKLFKVGNQHLNATAQLYYNAIKPDTVGDWTIRLQLVLLFPKK